MRVQINLSDEMVEKVDKYAKSMGVSRSALCSMFVGQAIMSYDKSFDMLNVLGDKIGEKMLAEKAIQKIVTDKQ